MRKQSIRNLVSVLASVVTGAGRDRGTLASRSFNTSKVVDGPGLEYNIEVYWYM
jgi:hypothetical protein